MEYYDLISRQQAINKIKPWLEVKGYSWGELNMLRAVINELENMPSAQPEHKAVFNRDIAIEAICDEVMLWFDVSATQAYEIADTAVKRIEVWMEKMNWGEQDG